VAKVQGVELMFTASVNSRGLERMIAGAAKNMRKEISLGVRDQLVIIERRHKKVETNRGGKSRAVSKRWTSRTGELSKSFHRDWRPGGMSGAYGSALPRARTIEEGGTIRAKGKYLAIPTENAPKGVWPRYVDNLFFIKSQRGNNLLVKSDGASSLLVMYILKKQVKLPPRPSLDRAIKNTEKDRNKRMDQAVDRALGLGNAK